jgi:heme A synthase
MTTAWVTKLRWLLAGLLLVVSATAAAGGYRQVVDGVAVYFGVMPAELVRGHPQEHPEGQMHGGVPVGENHIMVALFEDKTGATDHAPDRITITGRIVSSWKNLNR